MLETTFENLENILSQNLNTLICPCCKKDYIPKKSSIYKLRSNKRFAIYCSKSCGAKFKDRKDNFNKSFTLICSNCRVEYSSDSTINNKTNFCSKKCFHNYLIDHSHEINLDYFCQCGKHKDNRSKYCNSCSVTLYWENLNNTLLIDLLNKRKNKYNKKEMDVMIRTRARQCLDRLQIPKECRICKFNYFVDACHIRPVHTFDFTTTKLGEVNNINNLVYLCPNHHQMLDRKIELHLFNSILNK